MAITIRVEVVDGAGLTSSMEREGDFTTCDAENAYDTGFLAVFRDEACFPFHEEFV
jgi:hypothetical protein